MKTRYIVNEEDKVVTCLIEDCEVDLLNDVVRASHADGFEQISKKLLLPSKFVGIARCKDGDEFSEKIGRKIAFRKAKVKYCKARLKAFHKYRQTVFTLNQKFSLREMNSMKRSADLLHDVLVESGAVQETVEDVVEDVVEDSCEECKIPGSDD